MKRLIAIGLLVAAGAALAQPRPGDAPPLLDRAHAEAIAAEVSGATAKRTVEALAQHHRMRGSEGFNAAAADILARLRGYGLAEAEMIALPADGEIFYGTQRSRPAWNASFAELWDLSGDRPVRVANWAEQPISLAQDSVSGRAEAELVDIGAGTPADFEGKDLRGKLVLTSAQPSAVADRAVGEMGATGIVSWAQNQRTAWWGEDRSLVRWGHLDTFGRHPTFAFMVSPAQAGAWRERLARGEPVRLRAAVEAGRTSGHYLIPSALIPGRVAGEEIVFSCHLDHPRPGANDNASGCAGILEVARSLHRLIAEGALPQPRRGIRFVWPAEIEATIALLNARPEYGTRSKAAIHLDMIGGDTEVTKSILRVYGSPPSLPTFVSDVGFAIGRWVNVQTLAFADSGASAFPLAEPDGSRRALQAQIGGFNEGSDHQIWAEGSWRIPTLYIADWPDRYIHTQRDEPGNIDATKLKRAIFIAAASAFFLADMGEQDLAALAPALREGRLERTAETVRRARVAEEAQAANLWRHHFDHEEQVVASIARFAPVPAALREEPRRLRAALGVPPAPAARPAAPAHGTVYRRNPDLKGPMDGFGYSWLDDHLRRAGIERPALLSRPTWGWGPSFGYETPNLVDGRRTVREIRDDLAASVGPATIEEVADYLAALERLGVIQRVR